MVHVSETKENLERVKIFLSHIPDSNTITNSRIPFRAHSERRYYYNCLYLFNFHTPLVLSTAEINVIIIHIDENVEAQHGK